MDGPRWPDEMFRAPVASGNVVGSPAACYLMFHVKELGVPARGVDFTEANCEMWRDDLSCCSCLEGRRRPIKQASRIETARLALREECRHRQGPPAYAWLADRCEAKRRMRQDVGLREGFGRSGRGFHREARDPTAWLCLTLALRNTIVGNRR